MNHLEKKAHDAFYGLRIPFTRREKMLKELQALGATTIPKLKEGLGLVLIGVDSEGIKWKLEYHKERFLYSFGDLAKLDIPTPFRDNHDPMIRSIAFDKQYSNFTVNSEQWILDKEMPPKAGKMYGPITFRDSEGTEILTVQRIAVLTTDRMVGFRSGGRYGDDAKGRWNVKCRVVDQKQSLANFNKLTEGETDGSPQRPPDSKPSEDHPVRSRTSIKRSDLLGSDKLWL